VIGRISHSLRKGTLKDEDFPPFLVPYSATFSAQENGSPIYANVDAGANPQPVDWKVDNFGMFLQLSLKFGPYPVIDVH
jgi:hypothetical protein